MKMLVYNFVISTVNFINIFSEVSFEVSDITKQQFEPGTFDVIYSKDSILHIENKKELFSNFFVRPSMLQTNKMRNKLILPFQRNG